MHANSHTPPHATQLLLCSKTIRILVRLWPGKVRGEGEAGIFQFGMRKNSVDTEPNITSNTHNMKIIRTMISHRVLCESRIVREILIKCARVCE